MSDAEQADGNDTWCSMRKNLKGSMTREDIYKMARALSRDTSPSLKTLPKYPTNKKNSFKKFLIYLNL